MPMIPKAFKLPDYKARALHDYAVQAGKSDGELLRDLVDQFLTEKGYDPFDYIAPLTPPNRTNR
ncbi:hypothetical protein OG288_15785 [Streptomyces tauricus]|uniref:CopG family transcriptional regulator n=1 Tax=Streptomyces tauricus TaxID=68274 RepID=A0ABZ1JIU9_9ACTN|nr:hypothetical protein [Streptomyces tauricus]